MRLAPRCAGLLLTMLSAAAVQGAVVFYSPLQMAADTLPPVTLATKTNDGHGRGPGAPAPAAG